MSVPVLSEVAGAARDLARKGLTGAVGDPLPDLMSAGSVDWIAANQAEFASLVASFCALARAVEK